MSLADFKPGFQADRLMKTKDFCRDITQDLIRNGAILPEHVPVVCPSFAGENLLDPNNPDNRNGHDANAGHDPWSILDYIRDALLWPSDAVFIDAECFGKTKPPELRLLQDCSVSAWNRMSFV